MFYLRRTILLLGALLLFVLATAVSAQTPRPTPTNVGGSGGGTSSDSEARGSIQGHVYKDVNGDGVCVNSGVEGEVPVAGVAVQFTSSDEATIVNVTSGEDGGFGLFAAGQSYWRVAVRPESGWGATSENPLYVPVYPETLGHTGVDFCIAEGAGVGNGVIVLDGRQIAAGSVLLPEAGGAASEVSATITDGLFILITALLGLLLFVSGLALHRYQQ